MLTSFLESFLSQYGLLSFLIFYLLLNINLYDKVHENYLWSFVNKYISEIKSIVIIGLPIFGSQTSYMLMGVTDTIVAGRANTTDLAALAIGNSIFNPLWFALSGVLFAVTPIVAQLFGAKKFNQIEDKIRQILWMALMVGLALSLILINIGPIIKLLPIDLEVSAITSEYLRAIAIGAVFMGLFTCLRCFSEGMTLTLPVFYVAFTGMLINIPLDIILVNGLFGFPKLGGVGCGYATSLIAIIQTIAISILIMKSKLYKDVRIFKSITLPKLETFKEVFKLGIPIGFGIFIELSMFSGAALIISALGVGVIASHTIAINITSVFFMLPLAFGLATATRVGNLIGEQRLLDAEFSTRSSLLLCFVIAIITTITIYTFREFLVSLYTNDPQVIALGVSLLLYAAIFQIPDGVQMSAVGSLRGFKDTFVPMILILISYWVIALPAGFVMTYGIIGPKLGAAGMWIGMILGLSVFCLLGILRLKKVVGANLKTSATL